MSRLFKAVCFDCSSRQAGKVNPKTSIDSNIDISIGSLFLFFAFSGAIMFVLFIQTFRFLQLVHEPDNRGKHPNWQYEHENNMNVEVGEKNHSKQNTHQQHKYNTREHPDRFIRAGWKDWIDDAL